MRARHVLPIIAVSLALPGCNGDDVSAPSSGSLRVITVTTGSLPDPDGYSLQVDDLQPQPIGTSSDVETTGLAAGDHTVMLGGLAPNCSVSGANPRTVSVVAGATTPVSFEVTCPATPPTTGTIIVTTQTTGESPDPDGFAVTVDGSDTPIGVNARTTISAVDEGIHTVLLGGLAPNCAVSGENPRIVSVAAGGTSPVSFEVICRAAPTTGTIIVTTQTTGESPPDDFAVSVDSGSASSIGVNASITTSGMAAGTHNVSLIGVSSNCTVAEGNTRTIELSAGASVEVVFSVACSAVSPGTWTTGADIPSTERIRSAVATVKNVAGQSVVYIIGGWAGGPISKVQAYNASTDSWFYRASLPVPIDESNGAVAIEGKIYITGGRPNAHHYHQSLYVYDPVSNTWSQKADMPNPGADGVSVAITGKLYVLTYCGDQDHGCFDIIEPGFYRYDPATDQWTTLRGTRSDGSAVYHPHGMGGAIGGKFYVTGRQNADGVSQLDVYDPATDQWTSRQPMNQPRWSGAGVAQGGKLYVIGGFTKMPDGAWVKVGTTSMYDPLTNSWITKRAMPTPRSWITGSLVTVGGQTRIEVMGGPRPGNNLAYVP